MAAGQIDPGASDQRRLDAIPGIGEWTIAHLNLFGRGRYDVPLAKDVGMRNAYARVAGVRTGSVTEAEFAAVLNRYQPFQGLAAMYLVAAGWRSGAGGHNPRMTYVAAEDRYDSMPYRRCGRSGIKLPAISLGLWNRFGDDTPIENQRAIIRRAFDLGITHIDLANNYGPPYGSAEINFGRIYARGPRALSRRADHLDQGRLRHVARPVRRVGLAQVPDWRASTRA